MNDPLGQTHNPARSDYSSHLKIVLFCAIFKRTTYVKIVITTGRCDCESAEWIKISVQTLCSVPGPIHLYYPITRIFLPHLRTKTQQPKRERASLNSLFNALNLPTPLNSKLRKKKSRQVSSMIHSARPTVSPVVDIVFTWNLFCLARFWKVGTNIRTDGRTTRAKTMITTGSDCGSAEWINQSQFFWRSKCTWSTLHLWDYKANWIRVVKKMIFLRGGVKRSFFSDYFSLFLNTSF